MTHRPIAEPDYNFKLETIQGSSFIDRILFSNDILIIKCISGDATITINAQIHKFRFNSNFLLADNMIFKIQECSEDFAMTILSFSTNFLNIIYPMLEGRIIETMMLSVPDMYSDEDMEMTDMLFRQLCIMATSTEHKYRNKMAVNLTICYMLEICEQTYKYVKDLVQDMSDRRTYLIDKFFAFCKEDHSHHRNIEHYASRLNITSRYLYKICKESLQMTPKQCLDYIVSGNAKRLLLTSTMTNQQIANELNFPDQATFGQFFKRNVGMSPSEFRNKFK